jgi:phosphatidate phosphatase APP1
MTAFVRPRPRRAAIVVPYLGYGTQESLRLMGRVLRDKPLLPSGAHASRWRNVINMYKRFSTDKVQGARLLVRFGGEAVEVRSDAEGYFHVELTLAPGPERAGWRDISIELLDPPAAEGEEAVARGCALVPPAKARFGVISDIDDTIVATNVTSKLKMMATVLLSNEHTRMPFPGIGAFYRALQCGCTGDEGNPLFYVSNGPWNLYSFLIEFLKLNGIPPGPVFLRDFGRHLLLSPDPPGSHKLTRIEALLAAYPQLPFVLIGDSGERDPEIYLDVVHRHPRRVRVIYIRCVDRSPARLAAIDRLAAEVSGTDCQFLLVPDSEFAAVHAAAEGLIDPAVLPAIRADSRDDR